MNGSKQKNEKEREKTKKRENIVKCMDESKKNEKEREKVIYYNEWI